MNAVILASGSPSRYAILTGAGITPQVIVSAVDEAAVEAAHPHASVGELAGLLAAAKGEAVLARILAEPQLLAAPPADGTGTEGTAQAEGTGSVSTPPGAGDHPRVLIAADSILELHGRPVGKPHTAARTREVWQAMRGQRAHLHTGHFIARLDRLGDGWTVGPTRRQTASTTIRTAQLDDAELEAYIATAEPFEVAGALTIDGYGGAFVTAIEGDHHNVIGLSLPLLRTLCGQLGVPWHTLWDPPTARPTS